MKETILSGKIFDSNNFGKFKIIGPALRIPTPEEGKNKKEKYYYIEFLDTGFKTFVSHSSILSGRVKDKMVPNIAGVGYIGNVDKISADGVFQFYRSWNDMMNRCYNPNDRDYNYYGAIGVTVDPRWWSFENFFFDCMSIPGYNDKLRDPLHYALDKDYLQINIPKERRVYSKDTCIFISTSENSMVMNDGRKNTYRGVLYKDNSYCTRIDDIIYGRFDCPEAAAALFNRIYPTKRKGYEITILNDVPYMTDEELISHMKNKQRWLNDYSERK
jgi:hypothetical protein